MPVDRYLKEGNIAEIRSYLTENIYRYGKSIGTEKLLKKMTGNGFDVSYYIRSVSYTHLDVYKRQLWEI